MTRSDERGIALVVALFMVLILSVLGSSLVFVSRTETLSSLNYKTMSQTRYGAESGVHRAANHLLWAYVPPANPAEMALFDVTTSPVRVVANGRPVVLSTHPGFASNYPAEGKRSTDAFVAAAQGNLAVNIGTVAYNSRATLLAMRMIPDPFFPGQWITLQAWEITGAGTVIGAGSAEVEVSAVVERQAVPIYKFAAFATDPGCDALRFGGGAQTNSYDSSQYGGAGVPGTDNYGGNVGTNGNMNEIGATTAIHGTLSTPRTGVGACGGGNGGAVSALTIAGGATVEGGLVELPQAVPYPTPPLPNPMPPTGNLNFNGCPGGLVGCTSVGVGTITLDPALSLTPGTMVLPDVRVGGGLNVHLKPGVYIVNSLSFQGGGTLTVDIDTAVVPAQQVVFQVAGQNIPAGGYAIDFNGGTIANDTYDPSRFQIFYGGDRKVRLTGGSESAALVYAPNASTAFTGGGNFYGAVVSGKITDMGGASIHYDRNLDKEALIAGNPTLGSFTWSSF